MKQRNFIDVSHTIGTGLVTYKGLPAPLICDYLDREASKEHYAPGTTFQIGRIDMVGNTGTYIDAPFHRFAEGKDLSELPLASLADIDGVVIRAERHNERPIDASFFASRDLKKKAVLVHTGWSRYWRTEQYFEGHPFLTEDAAQHLCEAGAALVGIDSLNIDDRDDGRRPVHTALLGNDIPIVEHMANLDELPDEGFRFFATPVKVKAFGSFPVRAFALTTR
ncbi:MAG: cyclase family protein [Candidatus Krumholzibacteriia bacterium]